MLRFQTTILFLTMFIVSCKVRQTNKIVDAYIECYTVDASVDSTLHYQHTNTDTLKLILQSARGQLSLGYLQKGTTIMTLRYKNSRTKNIQFIHGRPLIFHYTHGFGKNIWYSVHDTTMSNQWSKLVREMKNKCETKF